MKIVVLDGYAANPGDLSWEPLRDLGELTVYERTAPADVLKRSCDADALFTNKVVLSADILSQLPKLRYVGVLATGYNVVDTTAARHQGIVVTNIPAYSTESVAQMVFAHLLNITNRVDHYAQENRNGRWSRSADFCYWDTPLIELAGKQFGVVGLGNIGRRVAEIAHQFGMSILAVTSKQSDQLPDYINKVSLPDLFANSDVISLHCPLTDDTYHLIDANSLQAIKQGAILINTGRGPLVDDAALSIALTSGRLMAYATDVLTSEPPQCDNPLLACPNAFITPHIAWATREARIRLMNTAIQNLRAFINGTPVNQVNQS